MAIPSCFVGLGSPGFLIKIGFALGLSAVICYAHGQVTEQRAFNRALAYVAVEAPHSIPTMNQESIDLALVLFSITVPLSAHHPIYDPTLQDRGLTSRRAFMDKAQVSIGNAAFTSWALLGSTLAHELEIHCQQNFLTIYVMDLLGMDGTAAAERQAYMHEINNAKRFGTGPVDTAMIADTVQFYYPEGPAIRGARLSFRSWMSATLLINPKRLL